MDDELMDFSDEQAALSHLINEGSEASELNNAINTQLDQLALRRQNDQTNPFLMMHQDEQHNHCHNANSTAAPDIISMHRQNIHDPFLVDNADQHYGNDTIPPPVPPRNRNGPSAAVRNVNTNYVNNTIPPPVPPRNRNGPPIRVKLNAVNSPCHQNQNEPASNCSVQVNNGSNYGPPHPKIGSQNNWKKRYRGKKAGRARQMNKQNQRNFVGFLYTVMETCSGEAKWNNRGNKRGGGRGGRGGEGEEKARALATIKKCCQ